MTALRPLAAALVLTGLCLSSAHAANLVANGSFEAPDIRAGGIYVLYPTGSTAITGWTVLGAAGEDVQLTPDTYLGLQASDGRQWVDLTGIYGYDKGVRSDAFATAIGATYRVTFDIGNYMPFGKSTLGVSINGGAEQLFVNASLADNPKAPMNWATFGFDWVADGTSARLDFLGRANGSLSNTGVIGLDNVGFELVKPPVPEPQTWALMLGGLGLVAAGARRRRPAA
ncbi:MAG TPA: PEPxxWA-CTERM sorting domain-containing protein [Burkholderiaceae bacterium]|jgi:hypothetical protein|nr:PEPxxWA-CTERM sorting domain-containing protein [Burkholderiaceae bacterium]